MRQFLNSLGRGGHRHVGRGTLRSTATVAVVALGLAACGGSGSSGSTAGGDATTPTTATPEVEAPSGSTTPDATTPDGTASATTAEAVSGETVTLQFAQWWEPELPDGAFRQIMDDFESANPGIKVELISGPYSSTRDQLFAGVASKTMPDVVGLDGAWVNEFAKNGALADLSTLMSGANYDESQLAAQIKVDGSTYMIPVVNFVYPMYVNNDLLKQAGIDSPPTTRTEFAAAATAVSGLGDDVSGWVLPLSLQAPNGIQNDVMSWDWASGGTMLKDGQPDVTNESVTETVQFVKDLWDAGAVAPGALTMTEQDKVEEFSNGRVGMMINTLSHINIIRESNPDLDFTIVQVPVKDGYTGTPGMSYASWGIGASANSEHPEEAWKLIEYLMSPEVNSNLSSIANAFPGNVNSTPDLSKSDPLFETAFGIFQKSQLINEFTGLPVAEELMRSMDEQLQAVLESGLPIDEALKNTQEAWVKEFSS